MPLDDLHGHGLICGVSGSGKTTTAKLLAEGFSARGIPVFAIDAKGDFAGISQPRASGRPLGPEADPLPPPVTLWDPDGRLGHRFSLATSLRHGYAPVLGSLRRIHPSGAGCVNVLHAAKLIRDPTAYADFLLRLTLQLAELAAEGSQSALRPQIVLILEEAHLLFRRLGLIDGRMIAEALGRLDEEQTAVVFIAPDPSEISDDLDALLGFRIQHALWTLPERTLRKLRRRLVKDATPDDADLREALRSLQVGEAFISTSYAADPPLRRIRVPRPATRDGPITDAERLMIIRGSASIREPASRRTRSPSR